MPRKRRKRGGLTARNADKYDLYAKSVQAPDQDVKFFDRVYRAEYGEPPQALREDFCAAGLVCCEWIKLGKERTALGIDLDPEPVQWGEARAANELSDEQRSRLTFRLQDVRAASGPRADVVAAGNFSYFIFKTRDELRKYFQAARRNLESRGIFVLDIVGGSEMHDEDHEEVSDKDGFKYVWEHVRFDPITHSALFHIHFRFPDGSQLQRAFSYDWRVWTIPEVSEILLEAGFSRVDVYWEGTDHATGEGNGVYRKRASAPADPCFVSYVVAVK